jgi:hypothetical protein
MNNESDSLGSLDREATATTRHDINSQVSVTPVLKLLFGHPKPDFLRPVFIVGDVKNAEADIARTGVKFTQRETHRGAAIAATAGLVKHEWAVNTPQLLEKNPSFLAQGNARESLSFDYGSGVSSHDTSFF